MPSRRGFLELGTAATLAGLGRSDGGVVDPDASLVELLGTTESRRPAAGGEVTVRQEPGKAFYWVLPGERLLSPHVFGTPESPRFGEDLLEHRIEQARQLPSPLCNSIPQLLQDLPSLVAAPEQLRAPVDHDVAREKLTAPTLFSDEAQVTSGEFEVTYVDRQPYDMPGPPGATEDEAELDASFTDPAGNEYELDLDHVIQPPIPGYQTGGGVLTGAWHHGQSGTGSPLMPHVYAYGACWGVCDVLVNGELATEDGFRVIHFMTTQTIRDREYRLALGEQLPLSPDETIAGQVHHTHGVVLPIKPTPEGPVFDPVPTAFELPNGETQPFIHAMWEQDTVVDGPFADWSPTVEGDDEDEDEESDDAEADVRLDGRTQAWGGVVPDEIEGEDNPTLELEAGTEYTLAWENADGLPHNFAIEDADGEDLLSTEIVEEQGATQSVTFTASGEMAEYYCQVHPQSMRGTVEVSD